MTRPMFIRILNPGAFAVRDEVRAIPSHKLLRSADNCFLWQQLKCNRERNFMNSLIRTLLALMVASSVFCSDGQSAETHPYLLLRFKESYRDNSVIGRRFAMFTELNGTNTC